MGDTGRFGRWETLRHFFWPEPTYIQGKSPRAAVFHHYECAIIHIQPVGAANELIRSIAYKWTVNIDRQVWFVETIHKCSKSLSQALKGGLNAPAAVFMYVSPSYFA